MFHGNVYLGMCQGSQYDLNIFDVAQNIYIVLCKMFHIYPDGFKFWRLRCVGTTVCRCQPSVLGNCFVTSAHDGRWLRYFVETNHDYQEKWGE